MNKYLLDYFYHILIGNIILMIYLFLLPTISIKENLAIYNIFLSIIIIFIILISLNYILILTSSKKIFFKQNKTIIFYNYIFFPFFVILSFIITFLFEFFKYNINTLYFYIFLFVFIIFSQTFTKFKLVRNNDSTFLKYKFSETFNIYSIGINKKEIINTNEIKTIKNIRKILTISYFLLSYIFILFLFILNYKSFDEIWIYLLFILFFTILFISSSLILFYKNKRYKLLNRKYFIINISILTFISLISIILYVLFKNNFVINNIEDSTFYSFVIIMTSIISKVILYGIYPYQIEYLKFYSKNSNNI